MPRQLTYQQRLDALRVTKLRHTREKQQLLGAMDRDDYGQILPPPDRRQVVEVMGTSGVPIVDVLLKGYEPTGNHANGDFYGAKAVGENFRALLEMHPPYVDPMSTILGGYCANFNSYRTEPSQTIRVSFIRIFVVCVVRLVMGAIILLCRESFDEKKITNRATIWLPGKWIFCQASRTSPSITSPSLFCGGVCGPPVCGSPSGGVCPGWAYICWLSA